MSRIRQIKPSIWLDKDLQTRTTADVREFYTDLWMLADDDGWLDWDVTSIGAEVYPFRNVTTRERQVARFAAVLAALDSADPHLVIHECGHAQVPKMPGHQRIGGTRTTGVARAHATNCCGEAPAPKGRLPRFEDMVR